MQQKHPDVETPNYCTYLPVSLIDVLIGSGLGSIIIDRINRYSSLDCTTALQIVTEINLLSLCALLCSEAIDMDERRSMQRIVFKLPDGSDIKPDKARSAQPMPLEEMVKEVSESVERMNDGYVLPMTDIKEIATKVDSAISEFLLSHTGQRVYFSNMFKDNTSAC